MLFFDGAFGLMMFALWIFCIIDVITTDAALCRNLQKPIWVLIVILLADVGAIVWLVAGRPWPGSASSSGPRSQRDSLGSGFPERRDRFAATNPDDDEDFLRQVRQRAEEQRRRYREEQKRRESDGTQD